MTITKPDLRGIFFVDDNHGVLQALEMSVIADARFQWKGCLDCADDLCCTVEQYNREAAIDGSTPIAVVVLDIEMPGRDVFAAAAELTACNPKVAIVFFSGSLTPDNCNLAFQASPKSTCVNKDEGIPALLAAIAIAGMN